MDKQIRSVDIFSAVEESEKMVVEGKAVSFDSPTVLYELNGVKYYEKIDRNAFNNCDMRDTCLKYNHDNSTPILARTRGGSLKTEIRSDGLYFRGELFNTTFGKDCYELIKQDALQCSFAFTVAPGGDEYDRKTRTRTINKIERLFDLSIVSMPAYSDTYVVQARSFFEAEAERETRELAETELKRKRLKVQLEMMEVTKWK
jgi:HK97 family phage prohead protease